MLVLIWRKLGELFLTLYDWNIFKALTIPEVYICIIFNKYNNHE